MSMNDLSSAMNDYSETWPTSRKLLNCHSKPDEIFEVKCR